MALRIGACAGNQHLPRRSRWRVLRFHQRSPRRKQLWMAVRRKPVELGAEGSRASVKEAFLERASALRLITAVALQVTGIWDDRRYLDIDPGLDPS